VTAALLAEKRSSGPTLLSGDTGLVPEPRAVLDELHADPIRVLALRRGRRRSVFACGGRNFPHGGRERDVELVLGGAGGGGRRRLRASRPIGGRVALLWQRRLWVGEGDGDGGVIGVRGRRELRGVSGGAGPPGGVRSRGGLRAGGVEVVRGGPVLRLMEVVLVVRVGPAQHQPPTQRGEAGNRGVGDRGALRAAGGRRGGGGRRGFCDIWVWPPGGRRPRDRCWSWQAAAAAVALDQRRRLRGRQSGSL